MWLSDDDFHHVIVHSPLISLDFVVTHPSGDWLLGQRNHHPAQGAWFVPGGRILKNETVRAAVYRLMKNELGQPHFLYEMHFLGCYEHFYPDSMFSTSLSTHYIVLAYYISLDLVLEQLPNEQHRAYRWWSIRDIVTSSDVHANTQAYLPAVADIVASPRQK